MIKLEKAKATHIQFFFIECEGMNPNNAYSANVIVNDSFIVQVSGNDSECDIDIPDSSACYWEETNMKLQDWASENLDARHVESLLELEGFENNRFFLEEHGELM